MKTLPVHIRQSRLFGSIADHEVLDILNASHPVSLRSGQHACRQGEIGESMFVIVSGRVSIRLEEPGGGVRVLNHLKPGDHFGEMSLLVGGTRSANVTAVMDTELIEITRPVFEHSLNRVPGFAANLCRSLGKWLQGQIRGSERHENMHVAIVRGCRSVPNIATQIATLARQQGGSLAVLSDQPATNLSAAWQRIDMRRPLHQQLRNHLSQAVQSCRRTLVDLEDTLATPETLAQYEQVLWVVDNDHEHSLARLSNLLESTSDELAGKIRLVQMCEQSDCLPNALELPDSLGEYQFAGDILRIEYQAAIQGGLIVPRDLSRLVNAMRGIQLGLALGGGGARGIAHIGVLEVLEREGIHFDTLAGTSAGAIVAAAYAAGIPLATVRDVFEKEMTPPRSIRWLPKSKHWYMLSVFRLGLAERKFRRYLNRYSFDQLPIPAQTVTVDLVTGEHRLRDSGDVVDAVLQSINHPVFGAPILSNGEALVDGGVLMNLPVTALRQKKVDYTLAVDVSKQLAHEFAGNTPETPTSSMKRPGYLSTLLRVTDVELINLARLHGAECDFLLAPDTAQFPFDDFTQAAGLVEAGRQAAEAELPRLKDSLDRALAWNRGERATISRAA